MTDRNIWAYDLEIYPNFHSCVAVNIDTFEIKRFMVHTIQVRNQLYASNLDEYIAWLTSDGLILVGFNNLEFDYQLLHIVLLEAESFGNEASIVAALYDKTEVLVNNDVHRFGKRLVPEWKHRIPQIDLYKIAHFDNSAKATSLKWVEFALRLHNVQDLPIKPGTYITEEQIHGLMRYNLNDTQATLGFLNAKNSKGKYFMRDAIALRGAISGEYNLSNIMNANDVKMGVEIFAKYLAESMGISQKNLKSMKTERSNIALNECLVDYLDFKSDEFNSIRDFLARQVISETKGVFSNIPLVDLGSVAHHTAFSEVNYSSGQEKPKKLITVKDGVKCLKKLNVVYKGFQYDFGTGGIHGCIRPGVYKENEDYCIIDV